MENSDKEFFESVAVLAGQICGLAEDVLPSFVEFANKVVCNRIKDINQIEHRLDSMAAYCFDDRVLSLYKIILRKIYDDHPDTVESYTKLYYEMFGDYEEVDFDDGL